MSEFEEKLNAILNDPGEMEKITRLAAELMGGGPAPPQTGAGTPPRTGSGAGSQARPGTETEIPPMDMELLGKLTKLMGGTLSGSDKAALLQALAPYLKSERQTRLQKALRAAKLAHLAKTALTLGGEDGV